tara:strand:+ start:542 stop:754 length:213 start_codon:yes stop_codon:yes gene_type:complete
MPRGSSWSEDEIISLTLAYLEISEDAATGTERKSEDFWSAIRARFQIIYMERTGTAAGIENAASRTSEGM